MSDKFIDAKLERLSNFTHTLARKVETCVPYVKQALESNKPLRKPFTSRESVALLEFGPIEEKLGEVVAAVAAVRKALNNRHKAKKLH